MPNLYELTGDEQALHQLIEEYAAEHDGDISDIGDTIDAWLQENERAIDDKVDAYIAVIKMRERYAAARKEDANALLALAKTDENLSDRLKQRLKEFMDNTGRTKIETLKHKLWTQNSGGKTPLVVDEIDINDVPPQYQKTKVEVDKESVRNALEAGKEVPFARFGERSRTLIIK